MINILWVSDGAFNLELSQLKNDGAKNNFLRQKQYSVATGRVPISKHETSYTWLKRCFFSL